MSSRKNTNTPKKVKSTSKKITDNLSEEEDDLDLDITTLTTDDEVEELKEEDIEDEVEDEVVDEVPQAAFNPEIPYASPTRRVKKYVNNADLLHELHLSHQQDKMTHKLAHMLQTLTKRYASLGKYANYSYNEDMQAYAMYMLCRTWKAFDVTKGQNPFAFFTQCVKRSFWQYLNKEKRHRKIRDELLLDAGYNPSHTFTSDYEFENNNGAFSDDYRSEPDQVESSTLDSNTDEEEDSQ